MWDSLPLENMEGTALHNIIFLCLSRISDTLPPAFQGPWENLDLTVARRRMSCCKKDSKASSGLTL